MPKAPVTEQKRPRAPSPPGGTPDKPTDKPAKPPESGDPDSESSATRKHDEKGPRQDGC